ASKITNNVGTVQSTGDIFVTSNDFQNIGRVTGLGNYEKYYETWDGIKLTEQEIKNEWAIDDGYDWGHGHYKDAIDDQKAEFEKFVAKNKNSRLKTYLLTKHEDFLRSKLGQDLGNDDTFKTGSALFPTEELTEKLKSNANTEYGKMIASGNIIINSGNVKNKDSLISGGGLVNINAANFENSVTIDTSTPIKLKKGYDLYEINVEKRSHGYDMTIFHDRKMDTKNFLVGYAAGQPSIIEGSVVNVNAPNIIKNPNEYGNGKEYENGGAIGKTLISSSSFGINKGTSSNNGQVGISANGAVDKFNSIFNGNSKVNGNGNNSFDRAIQISGNNSVIQNIKKTGTIDVNPLLSSAMFTMNMSPSSKYLLETRSKYISLGQYYGSDYFTSRVGYSEIWDRSKRLGDAFYENQLLTRALNEKLGTSFLNGKSNQELIQSMMDNAADEKARLGLVVGQALTQDQINALNEDIIWYVSKEVNGISVLTPQIYLSSRTRESISDDTRNRIGGINGTYVKTKDFVNDGTKWGNGGVTYVEANTVRNETTNNLLSEISGDQTYINAVGNIENIGGKIKGNEVVALISENGKVVNDTTKRRIGYDNGRYDSSWHDEIASLGEISSNGTTYIKANEYTTTGGILSTKNMIWDVNKLNADALKLSGEDRNGYSEDNFGRYSQTTHLGAGIVADATSGRIGDMNLVGSTFAGGDTRNLQIGKVNVESVVNVYESESKRTNKGFMSSDSSYFNNHEEENVAGNLQLSGARIEGNLTGIGSNIDLGENTFVGGKLTTDSRELHNSFYEKNTSKGFSAGISHGTASLNYGKSSNAYDEKDTINAKSNLRIGDGSVLNNGAEITATNFEYGNIQINNGDVKYGARIDTRDVHTSSKSSRFTISAGINSPALDRAKQVGQAVSQINNGDTVGGAMEAINAATGTIKGLADNQGTRQTNYDANGSVGKQGVKNASANNNFYANIGVNAGISKSKSTSNSHTESAVVTTMKPADENSSITYNNVNNITYQGTQAQGGTFVYNNVENIRKEAVELHNSSNSSSSSRGINAGATIGYGHKIQTTGNGGSISASKSNQNTTETIYQNGNFQNVNEVHNNTGTMTLSGFNQEGGKVTGNIGKLVVESRQNTSTTTGRSSGASVGISANGVPSSLNVNGSRTSGSRAFVDNQSSFIVGEGSNLHVGTVENTGAIIGKQSENGTTFKVDKYVGHDIQNYDTMTTTGISVGTSLGKSPRVTNIGFNQDDRDKQGITRNTVVGNVEIGEASGSPINRDITRANEVTKDKQHSTKINVESQTIEYATNPGKLKEDIGKAKEEINDIKWAIKESIHDRGDDNRNFFGQLSEVRLDKSLENITSERLIGKTVDTEIADVFKDAYKDLGYDINIIFSDPKNSPQLLDENDKPKTGTAYVRDENGKKIKTIIINGEDPKNATKAGLIGTIVEEGSHVIGKVEGRQRKTGTDEKGLESTGRASNEYFAEKYKDNNTPISIHSDGKDYSNVDFGENVGDKANEFADVGSTSIIPGLSYKFNMSGDEARKYVDQQLTSIFGTSVNWNDYFNVKNVEYREKMNYYFGLAKNTLRVKKIIGTFKKSGNTYIKIVQDNNKEMILKELPETEALYHNLKIVNGEIHMNFTNLNRKFVQDDGYELITTKNLKQLKGDPVNQATYNTYSYLATIMTKNKSINLWDKIKGSGDGLKHLDTDVKFWTLYGTSPQDPTNNKVSYNNMPSLYDQRQRLANRSLGKSIVDNYDIYKKAASYHNNILSLTQLENLEKNMSGIKKLTGNEQVNKIKSILGVK
ncbi:hemagglutinin repeat-containing protein, partial [uncultured Leptotrichia sp.]|uniref:hemagglutinin repeat-containing protein n=1 Tax=uncultured Leptotrichia sp. TaxID=159271 RepID=UPI00261DFD5B